MSGRTITVRRRLAWGETDPAGVIYAPQAFHFAIAALEELWIEALGISFRDFLLRERKATPWVHNACDFAAPIFAGEAFTLTVAIEKLGASSLAYRVEAAGADGRARFSIKMVGAMIDLDTMKPCAIPDDIRAKLSPYVMTA
jgi:acyl-CoA thioesterase FadM